MLQIRTRPFDTAMLDFNKSSSVFGTFWRLRYTRSPDQLKIKWSAAVHLHPQYIQRKYFGDNFVTFRFTLYKQ